MKKYGLVALVLFVSTPVLAQEVNTGYKVKGCSEYVLTYSKRVVQMCSYWKWTSVRTFNPQAHVNTSGD